MSKNSISPILRILLVIFIVLFLFNYVRMLIVGSGHTVTFGSFLDLISNYQTNFSLTNLANFNSLVIAGDWGVVDFLRVFLNSLTSIFSIGVYLALNLIDVIGFLAYFLTYAFVL